MATGRPVGREAVRAATERGVRPRRAVSIPGCAALPLGLALSGCSGMQSVLDPAGPYARRIAGHWWLMAGIGTAVLVIVVALFLYAVFGAKRTRPIGEAAADAGDDDDAARAKLTTVAIGVGLTIVILLVVMVQAIAVSRETYARGVATPVEIEITGHQWWWQVRYLDEAESRHVVSANELHIPVGVPVLVRLRSADVIHSFWVPNLQGKIDLVPGRENTVRILADRAGEWRGQCAEFCGLQHAKMSFVVVAHERAAFDAWRARELAPARPAADSLTRAGEQLFLQRQCAFCHTVRGTPAAGTTGPDLTHIASRRTIAAGTAPNTRGHLAGWILDPHGLKPGTHMPPTPLDGPELHALLAYLETLR